MAPRTSTHLTPAVVESAVPAGHPGIQAAAKSFLDRFEPRSRVKPAPVLREWPGVIPVQLLADIAALELALALGHLSRLIAKPWLPIGLSTEHFTTLAFALLLVPVGYYGFGLYPGYGLGPVERLRRRISVVGLLVGILVIWHSVILSMLVPDFVPSRGVLLATFVYACVLCPLADAATRYVLIKARCWGMPVLVLGAGSAGAAIVRTLLKDTGLGLVPVALFDDDHRHRPRFIEGVEVVGPLNRARSFRGKARMAILSKPDIHREKLSHLAGRLPFARVVIVPELAGLATLGIHAHDFGGIAGLEVQRNLLRPHNLLLKRVIDYVLGIPLLLLTAPVIALLAAWIKLVSPGPAFYAQDRVGVGGCRIRIWKLRTMYPDAEQRLVEHLENHPEARQEWEKRFKLCNDPRILPTVGHLLRRTSLDELPQLWNVVRGDMSLVGPRPFPEYHLKRFSRDFRALRQSVVPGVTGLWQVSSRSEGDLEVQETLDTLYIRSWSLWLDLYLLGKTVQAVLSCRGAY